MFFIGKPRNFTNNYFVVLYTLKDVFSFLIVCMRALLHFICLFRMTDAMLYTTAIFTDLQP